MLSNWSSRFCTDRHVTSVLPNHKLCRGRQWPPCYPTTTVTASILHLTALRTQFCLTCLLFRVTSLNRTFGNNCTPVTDLITPLATTVVVPFHSRHGSNHSTGRHRRRIISSSTSDRSSVAGFTLAVWRQLPKNSYKRREWYYFIRIRRERQQAEVNLDVFDGEWFLIDVCGVSTAS